MKVMFDDKETENASVLKLIDENLTANQEKIIEDSLRKVLRH